MFFHFTGDAVPPFGASLAFAGVVLWWMSSFLAVWATLIRDRCAEAFWFATTLGLGLLLSAGVALGGSGGLAGWLGWLLMAAAAVAMWIVARGRVDPSADTTDAFPRWQAAAWAYFLPTASYAAFLLFVPVGAAVSWAAEAPWLLDHCFAASEVALYDPVGLCDAARTTTQWWWLASLIGGGMASLVLLVGLVPFVAPRKARLRLVGFLVLAHLLDAILTYDLAKDVVEAPLALLPWIPVVALAAWAAFRPIHWTAVATASEPRRWRRPGRRTAIAASVVVFGLLAGAAAVFHAVTADARRLPVHADALARVRADDAAIARLGEPIVERWWLAGSTNRICGGDVAASYIPVEGPRGTGRIRLVAADAGGWKFSELTLLPAEGAPIDLMTDDEHAALAAWHADALKRKAARAKKFADGHDDGCAGTSSATSPPGSATR